MNTAPLYLHTEERLQFSPSRHFFPIFVRCPSLIIHCLRAFSTPACPRRARTLAPSSRWACLRPHAFFDRGLPLCNARPACHADMPAARARDHPTVLPDVPRVSVQRFVHRLLLLLCSGLLDARAWPNREVRVGLLDAVSCI